VAAVSAPQHVDVLVMVRASEVGRTDNDLPVSVPVALLDRALTHSAQYTDHQSRSTSSLGLRSPLNVPSNGEHRLAREMGPPQPVDSFEMAPRTGADYL
jgi:hypothetical protein